MWTRINALTMVAVVGVMTLATVLRPAIPLQKLAFRVDRQTESRIEAIETDDAALARWALDRFTAADLSLPPVVVEFASDRDACGGNTAVAVHGGAMPRVLICTDSDAEIAVKKALLHELAHIWANHSLDDEIRRAFMDVRGLTSWANGHWHDRGSEHAAEIVAWALMDRELLMLTLAEHDPVDLSEGYRVLTGNVPPPRIADQQ